MKSKEGRIGGSTKLNCYARIETTLEEMLLYLYNFVQIRAYITLSMLVEVVSPNRFVVMFFKGETKVEHGGNP